MLKRKKIPHAVRFTPTLCSESTCPFPHRRVHSAAVYFPTSSRPHPPRSPGASPSAPLWLRSRADWTSLDTFMGCCASSPEPAPPRTAANDAEIPLSKAPSTEPALSTNVAAAPAQSADASVDTSTPASSSTATEQISLQLGSERAAHAAEASQSQARSRRAARLKRDLNRALRVSLGRTSTPDKLPTYNKAPPSPGHDACSR